MSAELLPSLTTAAMAVDNRRRRSRQAKMGPSSVGGCRRKAGYEVAGMAKTDFPDKMAAVVGTWLHAGALKALQVEYGAVIEVAVEDEDLRGSADAVYLDAERLLRLQGQEVWSGGELVGVRIGRQLIRAAEQCTVEDIKTRGYWGFESVQEYGPPLRELFQTHLYADLLRRGRLKRRKALAGLREVPVERVRLRYVSRDSGKEWVWEQDYDPQITEAAKAWVAEVRSAALGFEGPESLPRDEDGPGLSVLCDGCPFLTRCWGPPREDGRMQQANLVVDDAMLQDALEQYLQLREAEKEVKRLRALNRAMLDAAEPAQYGSLVLSWSERVGNQRADLEAIRADYALLGREVPMTRGADVRTIGVKRAKAGPPSLPEGEEARALPTGPVRALQAVADAP